MLNEYCKSFRYVLFRIVQHSITGPDERYYQMVLLPEIRTRSLKKKIRPPDFLNPKLNPTDAAWRSQYPGSVSRLLRSNCLRNLATLPTPNPLLFIGSSGVLTIGCFLATDYNTVAALSARCLSAEA